MSSIAMPRSAQPTYQQRAGRVLEERTKAMIVAAAEQVMTARIAAEDSLEHLTMAEVCAYARGYLRRDGSEGPIPKATMWKHFKTVEALAAAVVDRMSAEGRPVPDRIVALAADPQPGRETVEVTRLEARFSSRHYEIGQLRQQFDGAESRDDRSDMLYWSAELAERHLQQRHRGERDRIVEARDWAQRGLRLVDTASRLDCMMGVRCTRAAAAAETLLSRRLDYEPTALSRVRSIKETEIALAETLGWDLHCELARFHIEHARALGEEDPEREMRSMLAIASALPALCQGSREPQDAVRAGELADIIVGLCGIDMAYATHPDHHGLYSEIFGDQMAAIVQSLLACFPAASGSDRYASNIRALLRLNNFARNLDGADFSAVRSSVENYREAAIDLLRTAEYGTVRDILVAHYLTAKARALASSDVTTRPGQSIDQHAASLVHPNPSALVHAAVQFYDHAAQVTSPRGALGVLRGQAARAAADMRCSFPLDSAAGPADVSVDGDFDTLSQAINDLVLITISRRNRFTDDEVQHLLDMVDPMFYYITSGRN